MDARTMRRLFLARLWGGLRVVWPILSVLLAVIAGLGALVGLLEGWGLMDGVYFAFVSGLTIGYGDLAPKAPLTRTLAVAIGFTGVLLTGIVVAVAVQALLATAAHDRKP